MPCPCPCTFVACIGTGWAIGNNEGSIFRGSFVYGASFSFVARFFFQSALACSFFTSQALVMASFSTLLSSSHCFFAAAFSSFEISGSSLYSFNSNGSLLNPVKNAKSFLMESHFCAHDTSTDFINPFSFPSLNKNRNLMFLGVPSPTGVKVRSHSYP